MDARFLAFLGFKLGEPVLALGPCMPVLIHIGIISVLYNAALFHSKGRIIADGIANQGAEVLQRVECLEKCHKSRPGEFREESLYVRQHFQR